jgi:hypothetical protein
VADPRQIAIRDPSPGEALDNIVGAWIGAGKDRGSKEAGEEGKGAKSAGFQMNQSWEYERAGVTFPAISEISETKTAEGWSVVADWAADAEMGQSGFGDILFGSSMGAVAAVSALVALFRTGSPDFAPFVAASVVAGVLILLAVFTGINIRGGRIKFGYDFRALRARAAAYRLRALEFEEDGDQVAVEQGEVKRRSAAREWWRQRVFVKVRSICRKRKIVRHARF